jgi:ATP-dependent HslUV protease ATP-binding subunit HslU
VADNASPLGGFDIPGQPGFGMVNIGDMLRRLSASGTKRVRTTVKEALQAAGAGRDRQAAGR